MYLRPHVNNFFIGHFGFFQILSNAQNTARQLLLLAWTSVALCCRDLNFWDWSEMKRMQSKQMIMCAFYIIMLFVFISSLEWNIITLTTLFFLPRKHGKIFKENDNNIIHSLKENDNNIIYSL